MTSSSRPPISRLGARWIAAGQRHGFEVVAPFTMILPGSVELHADALITQFGAKKGMLIFSSSSEIWPARHVVDEAGYGFSVMAALAADHSTAEQDLDGLVEVLRDWGWAGRPGSEPPWLHHEKQD